MKKSATPIFSFHQNWGESVSLGLTPILFLESTVVEEICENCSLIGFGNFTKGFEEICKGYLSQSTSTRIGVTDSIHLTEFYLKVFPFGEPFFSFW